MRLALAFLALLLSGCSAPLAPTLTPEPRYRYEWINDEDVLVEDPNGPWLAMDPETGMQPLAPEWEGQ